MAKCIWAAMNEYNEKSSVDEDDDVLDEIEIAGLDRDELEFMDEDERREALEDAGLNTDDFYDEF
ncbi:hypothetical protein [Butyrivibrio sp. MC2013]|uniref:hypothetical protein n=1 Tax=Butyrivibrio sp. MC2013 TaxID=1280686 RepID=UPI00040C71A2|nr:hypothetical protein [Butyrivibrio sp. MC2013]